MAVNRAKQVDAPRSRDLGPKGGPLVGRGAKPSVTEADRLAMKLAGAWIRDARIAAGVSQKDLLEKLNANNPTTVSFIENGRRRLTPQFYEPWGRAIGLDPKEIARNMIGFYTPFLYEPLFGEPFRRPE